MLVYRRRIKILTLGCFLSTLMALPIQAREITNYRGLLTQIEIDRIGATATLHVRDENGQKKVLKLDLDRTQGLEINEKNRNLGTQLNKTRTPSDPNP